jgi:hypothetical protein
VTIAVIAQAENSGNPMSAERFTTFVPVLRIDDVIAYGVHVPCPLCLACTQHLSNLLQKDDFAAATELTLKVLGNERPLTAWFGEQ